jgi:hypothetical protein
VLLLLAVYSKAAKEDLTDDDKKGIRAAIRELESDLR